MWERRMNRAGQFRRPYAPCTSDAGSLRLAQKFREFRLTGWSKGEFSFL